MKGFCYGIATLSKNVLAVLVFFAVWVATLALVTGFSYSIQKQEQQLFADEILTRSEYVTAQIKTVLDEANRIENFQCDHENLNKLRRLVQLNSEIYDLGFVQNHNVICSANWGRIEPVPLYSAHSSSFGPYAFYSNEENLYHIEQTYNVTTQNQFFTANLTTIYATQISSLPSFQFDLISTISGHIFESYKPQVPVNFVLGLNLSTTTCSEQYSYCLKTYTPNAGIMYFTPERRLMIVCLSSVFAWFVTYFILILREKRNSIEVRFKQALKKKSLFMEYQPIVSIADEQIHSVESLVRWEDDVYGRVSPDLFIGIAEKLTLYPQLAYFTAETAIRDIAPILQRSKDFSVGINISTFEVQDAGYLDFIKLLVVELKIDASQVKIEITERIAVDLKELADFSKRARSYGFMIVLDDFGTGVANLVWLTEMNFDFVKVDRLFVNALNYDLKKTMVSPIMSLLTSLYKEVVFEGVETELEYQIIKENCESGHIQGWYFYKSLKLRELKKVLEQQCQ